MTDPNKIPSASIREVADRLREIISQKKEKLASMHENMQFVEKLARLLSELNIEIEKGRSLIKSEEKEITEMHSRLQEIETVPEIHIDNPACENSLLSFVEAQSIVSNADNSKVADSTSSVNSSIKLTLDRIKQFLKDHKAEEENPLKSIKKEQSVPKYFKNVVQPEEFKIKPAINDAIESTGLYFRVKDQTCSLATLKLDLKNIPKSASELASIDKFCKECHKYTKSALILKCRCVYCIECLPKIIFKRNEKLLLNTFEAQSKKQEAMCVCPQHNAPISLNLLTKLFGEHYLEKMSLEALKRQLKECTMKNLKFPNLCIDCKILIRDDRNPKEGLKFCQKHKICLNCFEYFCKFIINSAIEKEKI